MSASAEAAPVLKVKRFSQPTLHGDGVDLWAVPSLYGLVKEVAPQFGFNAITGEASVTVTLEAVEEGADLHAFHEALENRGLCVGYRPQEER